MFSIYDSHGKLIEADVLEEKAAFVTSYEFIHLCHSVLPDVITQVAQQVPHLNIGHMDIRRGRELYLDFTRIVESGEVPYDIQWYNDTLSVIFHWCLRWHLTNDLTVDEDLAFHYFHMAEGVVHCRSLESIEALTLERLFYLIYRNVCDASNLHGTNQPATQRDRGRYPGDRRNR